MRRVVDRSRPGFEDAKLASRRARNPSSEPVPEYALAEQGLEADFSHQLVHGEPLPNESARLRLAIFVTTG